MSLCEILKRSLQFLSLVTHSFVLVLVAFLLRQTSLFYIVLSFDKKYESWESNILVRFLTTKFANSQNNSELPVCESAMNAI